MKRIITKDKKRSKKTISIDEVSDFNFIGVEWKYVSGRGIIVRTEYDKFIEIDLGENPDHYVGSEAVRSKAECVANEIGRSDKEFYVFDSQKELLQWIMEALKEEEEEEK